MKNKEKFAKEIVEIAIENEGMAVVNGVPCACGNTQCDKCDLDKVGICYDARKKWAEAEYVEYETDWSKVPVDTPILVKLQEPDEWQHRHFAEYKDGKVRAWMYGATSWSKDSCYSPSGWQYAELANEEDKIKYRKVKND